MQQDLIDFLLDIQIRAAALRNHTKPYKAYIVADNIVGDISTFCDKHNISRGNDEVRYAKIKDFEKKSGVDKDQLFGFSVKSRNPGESTGSWVVRNAELCEQLLVDMV